MSILQLLFGKFQKKKMGLTKLLKGLILAISFSMFCYQAHIAICKLIDPPVVDSTDVFNIADIEAPLITICPMDQFNRSKLANFGYDGTNSLLTGYSMLYGSKLGWGAQHNLSFEELLKEVQDVDQDYPKVNADYEKRFYPRFGRCIEVVNHTIPGDIQLLISIDSMERPYAKAEVFITDRKLRTMSTIHKPSHWGSSIIIQSGWMNDYLVEVKQMSNFDPRKPDDCKEYAEGEFEKCVDDGLQDIWRPIIKCNPIWISPQNQCKGVVNVTADDMRLISNQSFPTLIGIDQMDTYPAKERCAKPCTVTKSKIISDGKVKHDFRLENTLNIKFESDVVYRRKVLAYDFSSFLIDMGSSLGLWFGLSVFGITDMGIFIVNVLWSKNVKEKANHRK